MACTDVRRLSDCTAHSEFPVEDAMEDDEAHNDVRDTVRTERIRIALNKMHAYMKAYACMHAYMHDTFRS